MSPVVVVGMVVGVVLVATAVVIFYKQKAFPNGGVMVTVVGLVFIGMSQWTTIEINANGVKLSTLSDRIDEANKDLEKTAKASSELADQVDRVADETQGTRQQLLDLTGEIKQRKVLPPPVVEPIQHKLATPPQIDRNKLKTLRESLVDVQKRRPAPLRPGARPTGK